MKMLRAVWMIVLMLGMAGYAHGQATIPVSGTKVTDNNGNLLTGQLVFTVTDTTGAPVTYTPVGGGPTTATITIPTLRGVVQNVGGFVPQIPNPLTMSPSNTRYQIQVQTTGGATTYLDLVLTNITQPFFSYDAYTAPPNITVNGIGLPKLPCTPTALYHNNSASDVHDWVCSILQPGGSIYWTQNPSENPACQGQAQAVVSPSMGPVFCTQSMNAYATPGLVIGSPTPGGGIAPGPIAVIPAPTSGASLPHSVPVIASDSAGNGEPAVAAGIVGLFSGPCTGTNVLQANGGCGANGGGVTPVGLGANQFSNITASAFVNGGLYNIDVYATGGGNNGQGNFFGSSNCIAGGSCFAVIPPTSPDTTGPGLGYSASKLSSTVIDYRANSITTISFNPQLTFASIFEGGTQTLFPSQVDYTEASPSLIQGSPQTHSSVEYLSGHPGFSNGISGCPDYCPNSPHTSVSQWAFNDVDTIFASFNGSGINNVHNVIVGWLDTGDSQGLAEFDTYAGGCVAPSDECHHWQSVHLMSPPDFEGTITSSTDPTHFFVTPSAAPQTQGQGRFLTSLTQVIGTDSNPILNVPVALINKPGDAGFPFGTVVLQTTALPNSTFQGVTASACNVPVQEGGVATCTVTVTVNSGQLCATGSWNGSSCVGSTPAIVSLAFNTGNRFNFAEPISVTAPSGGTQSLTISLHRSIPIGSIVFQGGLAGSLLGTNESPVISNVVGLQGYPIIGSFGGNTVAYINYDGSQVWQPIPNGGSSWGSRDVGNTTAAHGFTVINLARHSGVVTGISTTGFDSDKWKELAGAFDFNVNGCTSDPTLNSISVGSPIIFNGPDPSVFNPHIAEIAYTQSGPDTVTPCTATIATQFTASSIFWTTEVYDVMNHITGQIDGTFVTSYQPNFTVGTPVDEPTHYAAAVNGIQVSSESGQPLIGNTSYISINHGYASLVGASFFGQNFATNVMGSNGISNPLDLVGSSGLFNTGINLAEAPPNNGSAIRIGPPDPLFASQNSSFRRYGIVQTDWAINHATAQILFDDDTQSWWWNYNTNPYPSMIFGPNLTNLAVQVGTTPNVPVQIGELRLAEFGSDGPTPFGPLFHIKQCAPLSPPSVTGICYSSFIPTNAVVTQGGAAGTTEYIYILQGNDAAGPAYGSPMFTFAGNAALNGTNFNIIPCSDLPAGMSGIIWNFQNSIGFSKVGTCASNATPPLHDTGTYPQVVGPNGTTAGSILISGGFEATGLLGGYYFSQPDIYGSSTPALSITAGISQKSAGVLSIDTTAQGNSLGSLIVNNLTIGGACTGCTGTPGVTSIDTLNGAFTFGGPGVSHTGNAYTFSGSGGAAFDVNGTALTSSSTVNFLNSAATNGLTLTFNNPSAGNVQLGLSGTLNNSGLTNSSTSVNGQSCSLGGSCAIPNVTSSVAGLAPASGGGSTNFLRADGTWAVPAGGSGITGGVLNFFALFGSSSTITGPGHLDDGATSVGKLTATEEFDVVTSSGLGGGFDGSEGTAHSCASGFDDIWADSTSHGMRICNNAGSSSPVTQTIASGTSALGTSAIASGACATVVTTTATGTAGTDAITWNPNGSIKAVTGYIPSTSGGLTIAVYPTTNAVNWDVCNWTSSSITPGAVTLNWSVTR